MGIPKHGKDSARSKSSKKYKDNNNRAINKARTAEKLADGKHGKSRKMRKTTLMLLNDLIRNTPRSTPFFDEQLGVLWGTNKDDPDTIKNAKRNGRKNRNKRKKEPVTKGVYSKIPVYKLTDTE